MTVAAASQGIKNALICLVPVLAESGFVYWLLSTFTASSQTIALFSAFMLPFAVSLFVMLVSWLRGIQLRGELLIDCGQHPGRRLFLFNAVMFLVLGYRCFSFGALGTVFTISFSAYWLFMATGRFAVHKGGLWVYHAFLPWDKISHYSWASGNTLTFKTTNGWLLSRGAIPVPVEFVDDVTQLLSEQKT